MIIVGNMKQIHPTTTFSGQHDDDSATSPLSSEEMQSGS
jgi:hypothetical protein